jgi:hypothetical protein
MTSVAGMETAQGIVEIGHKLIEVKQELPHGQFGTWLAIEFDWSDRTARRFMDVAKTFKSDTVSNLSISPSALYMLSSGNVPETARKEAIERSTNGEQITKEKGKEITDRHKGTHSNGHSRLDNPSDYQPQENGGYDIEEGL